MHHSRTCRDQAADLGDRLVAICDDLGKPAWRDMLRYLAHLHAQALHPPSDPLPAVWEEIGPGYHMSPAFGHWDVVHQILDEVDAAPEHALQQLLNDWALQLADGILAGSVFWGRDAEGRAWTDDGRPAGQPHIDPRSAHPPMWPAVVDALHDRVVEAELLPRALAVLEGQLGWFERERRAEDGGFFYRDIVDRDWESGVDEGLRFDAAPSGRLSCIDATCHLAWCYAAAARWSEALGREAGGWRREADRLGDLVQNHLWHDDDGFFYDSWLVDAQHRPGAFEGFWPLACGVATPAQAQRLIEEHLLRPERFATAHPLPTVAASDPGFELRMWRGPAWNSMTLWIALGAEGYGHRATARQLVEAALDDTARWFDTTGTIWEFYHPHGGDPRSCQRKPQSRKNRPCHDYLGHNPLIAMAQLWERCG